jgi:hypothetical protein
MGAAPLAAKATADAEIAKHAGTWSVEGLGDASLRLAGGSIGSPAVSAENIPYERRLIGAADYIKMFGLPEVIDFELRDRSRYVTALDPDIACKRSWSMSVKIATQRQRNYEREVERLKKSGWQQRGRSALTKLMGFEWPW